MRRDPRGSRSRRLNDVNDVLGGTSIETCNARSAERMVYERGPKLVGVERTAIRLPGVNHPRGVACASSSPTGRPFESVVS